MQREIDASERSIAGRGWEVLGIGGCSFLEVGQGSGDVEQRSGEVEGGGHGDTGKSIPGHKVASPNALL